MSIIGIQDISYILKMKNYNTTIPDFLVEADLKTKPDNLISTRVSGVKTDSITSTSIL